jgi:hypothetical protein
MSSPGARERDPFFRKILEGLTGHLDPQLFEECVQDLLREDFPGLAGVHGGSDAGMDGAIPDGEGSPFTLVVTTRDDVIGNLTQSLKARLAAGDTRRKAVLATSQALSPRRRSNLERRAEKLGFVLVQTFDSRDIASRLSRNSRWTKMLLGITGDPPALSTFPRTHRDLPEVELAGRNEDLAWLRAAPGDRLIVGEPGSGKTSLLLELVKEGRALFLASEDERRFAEAYLNQRPEIVLVDDAHLDPGRLDRLRQVRRVMEAEDAFTIVATSWKGHWEEVADALGGLSGERVRHLDLLTPAEILEVLRRIGVQAPEDDPFLAELVGQAAGRPGLAVTLGTLFLRGGYREVLTGRALYRSLVSPLRRILEQDPTQLLAAFALGGDRGMGLAGVAEFLDLGIGEVWNWAAQIGASGVLSELGKDDVGEAILAVIPATLRVALLHEVFFSPAARAWERHLRRAPSLTNAIENLVLAAGRQVPVPRADLRRLLLEAGSPEAWRRFILLGEAEGAWALEHYPRSTADIAAHALRTAPTIAIRRIFKETEDAAAAAGPRPEEVLEIIRDWVEEIPNVPEQLSESLRRRRLLVEAAMEYMEEPGDPSVALRAAFLALSPRLETTRMTATGGGFVWRHGSLPASAASEMLKLWQRVRGALGSLDRATWRELENTLHWWLDPSPPGKALSEEELEEFDRVARHIVLDLVPFAVDRPGLGAALLDRAKELDLELAVALDPVFETLYPSFLRIYDADDPEAYEQALQATHEAARDLAREWSGRFPTEVVDDLARYAAEAEWSDGSAGTIGVFEGALAEAADTPETWLRVLLEKGGRVSLVKWFLLRVVEEQRPGWEAFLDQCLGTDQYTWVAAERVLGLTEPPEALLELAIERVEPQLVETSCLQGQVPASTLRRLLSHCRIEIALPAATGEWLAEPRHSVRPAVQQEWREAVLRAPVREVDSRHHERYWLKAILSREPDLAFEWLRRQFEASPKERRPLVTQHGLIAAAIRSLDASARERLLTELPRRAFSTALLSHLVGESPELYRRLLSRSDLKRYHLAPLSGKPPDDPWIALAQIALVAGYPPQAVAEASFHFVGVFSPTVEHYAKWETAFRALSTATDPTLTEVARHGLRQAERLVWEARKEKRRLELTGRL